MGFSDKRGMSGLTVTLIIGVLIILFMLGGAGNKILEGAESLASTLGITTAKSSRVKATTTLLTDFYNLCAAEPGTNCVCSHALDLYQPELFSDKDTITFSQKGSDMQIDFVGTLLVIKNTAPCFVSGLPQGFASFGYFADKPALPFRPDVTRAFTFEYDKKNERFWFKRVSYDEPMTASMPLKAVRLVKLQPNYLCVLDAPIAEGVRRTCANSKECFGNVCSNGKTCSSGKRDPYYTGQGVCCSGQCV